MEPKQIEGQISIIASYEDSINIKIHDKTSGITFVDMTLTREQFVNAAMNRLGNAEVSQMEVRGLDKVGKKMEMKHFEFPLPDDASYRDERAAEIVLRDMVADNRFGEWEPEISFGSRGSFFEKDGKQYARILLRRWV